MASDIKIEEINQRGAPFLPGHLGIQFTLVEEGKVCAQMPIEKHLLAPNGYLHAGSIVTLADSCAGFGCATNLPNGANGFTTIELKSNFLGTLLDGVAECSASLIHGGKTTQVWDAVVSDKDSDKTLALFRCTQMILYPK